MTFAKIQSGQVNGLRAHIIDIEVDITGGIHSFSVVGLPDKAVEEAKDRISSALKNSGFKSPKNSNQKITISLAPADIRKEGPVFDFGMAIGYLLSTKELSFDTKNKIFVGELSLDGSLRKISGILPIVREAKERGFLEVFVPSENAEEAALIREITIYPVKNIREAVDHLNTAPGSDPKKINPQPETKIKNKTLEHLFDLSHIKGQESAKRALSIAAAGGHNVCMYGPPGTGKTMLAKAFCGILPELDFEEMLEVTSIHSVVGILKDHVVTRPPFRSPHHTSSYVSIIGGGAIPKPGEVTLAHYGVLFLDEFPEFDRRVIDSLRQPLEEKVIHVSRSKGSSIFPANCILLTAMNPCPCGYFGIVGKKCTCAQSSIQKYKRKISGPIVDRIDIWINVGTINHEILLDKEVKENESEKIREIIRKTRNIQKDRTKKIGGVLNGELSPKDILKIITLNEESRETLTSSARRLGFSPRVFHKLIKVSRTIADLEESEEIKTDHILEAIQYRPKEGDLI